MSFYFTILLNQIKLLFSIKFYKPYKGHFLSSSVGHFLETEASWCVGVFQLCSNVR